MKKLLSILLVVTFILGMTFSAGAAVVPVVQQQPTSIPTITSLVTTGVKKINESDYKNQLSVNAQQGRIVLNDSTTLSVSDLNSLEVAPGDVIKIYMTGSLFLDVNDNPLGAYSTDVALSALTRADVAARATSTYGEGALKVTLEGNKNNSYIKIAFSSSPAFEGQKFAYSVYLAKGGSRKSVTRVSVKGVLESEVIEVDSDDDYIDLSDGATIKAITSVRNIELYLGEDCSITRNLSRGKQYCGIATTDILQSDEKLFGTYRDLEIIYRLETVGLKGEGNIVRLDTGDKYYVYNSNGTYIGTTNNALPYWTKYYLTSKKYESLNVVR